MELRCVHGTRLPVRTLYKTSGVYMVQYFRCVHGTRLPVCTWHKTSGVYMVQDMSIQIYVPPLKDTASPKTAMCWLWRKQFDTQLVIFYLYSQSVSDIRNTTQIIQLSLFVSSWSLAQPTDDFTRSVVAEKLLFIFLYHGGVDTFNQDSTHDTIYRNKYTCKHFVGGVCILSEIFSKNRFNIGSKTLHDIVQTCKENRTEVVETGIVPK